MIFERKKYLDELIAGRGISAPRLNTTSQTSAFVQPFSTIDSKKKVFTFRKILPSKVGIDEKAKSCLKTLFNTKSQQLTLLKEETVNLDEQMGPLLEKNYKP